jgi:hypothetical protein
MLNGTRHQPEAEVLPLGGAVFCLDCEVISNSRDQECPACKGHSLLSLSRILGGSLRGQQSPPGFDGGLFDITLSVELRQMHARDVNTTVEGLTAVIGPRLAQGRASFHINVQPVEQSFRRAA